LQTLGTDGRQYGVGVPNGEVARTPEEAEAIAKKIGTVQDLTLGLGHLLTGDRRR
jgi:hypothetical protein